MTRPRPVGPARRLTRSLALAAVALALVGTLPLLGCKDLTSVDAPDVRQPGDYATAAGASALATGASTRFTKALGGNFQSNQVVVSGLMADELFTTIDFWGLGWDNRNPVEPSVDFGALYNPLHTARINLLTAIASFERTAPDSSARIGELFAFTGYTEVFLAENFCAGESLGRLDANFTPTYGPPLTSQAMYEQAVADFDSALVHGADSARILQLAQVGKGRALVNLGRFSEAAAAVASVPTTYVYAANFVPGTETTQNGVWATNGGRLRFYSVPEQEGGNGINWRTAMDPRVPLVKHPDLGYDGVTEIWMFAPYQAGPGDSPIPFATGLEARLIEAEAALQANDAPTWLSIHNTLRATVGLGPLADPGTEAARVDLHFRERAFWLFLTGHRLGDLRRLVRQYGRDAETVFPTGVWRNGQPYGTATNMSAPAAARNNPNYAGCLNRGA